MGIKKKYYYICVMKRKLVKGVNNMGSRYLWEGYIDRHKELMVIGSVRDYLVREGRERLEMLLYSLELIYDVESKFYKLGYNDRVKEISRHIYGDEGLLGVIMGGNNELVNDIERLYDVIELRYLRAWEKKVEERINFLENVNYSISNAKLIDELMLRSKEILEQKKNIKSLIIQEKKGKIKGGQKLSLLAERRIRYDKEGDS